ncbi:MAG: hypothetical protein R2771_02660 [Saprospiraceae bacterium]
MKTLKIITALFFVSVLLNSCEKDPYAEDKENHTFFRCKVNGKEWHNEGYGFYGDLSTISYNSYTFHNIESRGAFAASITYRPNESIHEHLSISKFSNLKIENNSIENTTSPIFFDYTNDNFDEYYLDTLYHSNLYIIDIDSIIELIKGEFEFRGITKDGLKTINITDGEFDWKVYWYK